VEAGALAEFKNFITAWGGHLFNGFPAPKENPKEPRWEPTFYSPQNVKAMTFVWDMVHKYKVTPPGVSNMNFDTSATAFDAGLTAMSYNYANLQLDKGVPGSIEYFVQPYNIIHGKKYDSPHFGTWMIGINKYSSNKYWSWKLLEWLTSTPVQNEMLQEEIHPTRISAYDVALKDKALTKKFGNFYQVMYQSLQIGLGRPRLEDYSAVSNIVHVMYNNIVSGKEPIVTALKQGDTEETALLQSLGYLPK
jgi:multiple sugar transport system substrate-binding protein